MGIRLTARGCGRGRSLRWCLPAALTAAALALALAVGHAAPAEPWAWADDPWPEEPPIKYFDPLPR